jgi:hypothetical protein
VYFTSINNDSEETGGDIRNTGIDIPEKVIGGECFLTHFIVLALAPGK